MVSMAELACSPPINPNLPHGVVGKVQNKGKEGREGGGEKIVCNAPGGARARTWARRESPAASHGGCLEQASLSMPIDRLG